MVHVDDGQLNALLDGELNDAERQTVEAHLAGCAECRVRFEEAKAFLSQATDLLGTLDAPVHASKAPAAPPRPGLPMRTVATTGQERAIDPGAPRIGTTQQERAVEVPEPATVKSKAIDVDVTRKSVAIRPLFGKKGAPPPEGRPFPVAWAAMLVLAVGAGWMANEIFHQHPQAAAVAGNAASSQPTEVAANTPPPAAEPTAEGPARQHATTRTPLIKPPEARGEKPPNAEEAADHIPTSRPPGASRADTLARAEGPAPVTGALAAGRVQQGNTGAGALATSPTSAAQAPAPALMADAQAPRAAARQPSAERDAASRLATTTTFHRISMDEAVRRLSGSIRLIDGMQPVRVETGPGSLVPGASPDRDVVRVVYADAHLGALTLDQQSPATGAQIASINGLMPGDTLVTQQPDGSVRVRWVDGKGGWLSLTGRGDADEVRAFVDRVR